MSIAFRLECPTGPRDHPAARGVLLVLIQTLVALPACRADGVRPGSSITPSGVATGSSTTEGGAQTVVGSPTGVSGPGTSSAGTTGTTGATAPACYLLHGLPNGGAELAVIPATPGLPIPTGNPFWIAGGFAPTNGLTWFDGFWWACRGGDLVRIDSNLGAATELTNLCSAMTTIGSQLAVDDGSNTWSYFDTAADVLAATPSASVLEPWDDITRVTSDTGVLYGAWHHADHLEVVDLATDAQTQLPLAGFDARVSGVAILNGTLRVLDGGDDPAAAGAILYREFNLSGGELTRVAVGQWLNVDHLYYGLWCGTPTP